LARIYWDTNLFIYFFEDTGALADKIDQIRRGMLERGDRLYTGSITVGEVLVGPVVRGHDDAEERYLEFFRSSAVEIVQFDLKAAPHYARIRLDRSIGPADAIQLACAATAEVDMFITNDDRLSRKRVPGIKFIVNLANAPT
jgi:predicted nucleic acid-binding protein